MCNAKTLIIPAVLLLTAVDMSSARARRWVVDDSGCRTPDNGVGNCIPLSQCTTLKSLASNSDNLKILQKYFCAYKSSVISVCCPKQTINVIERKNTNSDLLPKDCGTSQSIHRIINGENTDLFEFPWQEALRYDDQRNPFGCAGSLINDRYVLTAAHCTRGLRVIGVRLGEHNFATNPDCQTDRNLTICAPRHIDIPISNKDITEHENFVPNVFKNDVSLIRLPRRIQFSESVSPVCLPTKETFIKDLGNLTVIGWGRTETNKPSPILLKVTVPLMNINLCRAVFRGRIEISDNQFCAGGKEGKDSCRGDSGGPIMYSVVDEGEIRWVQAGIVSFGAKFCGTEKVPAMYTKLTAYTDWILNNLRPS